MQDKNWLNPVQALSKTIQTKSDNSNTALPVIEKLRFQVANFTFVCHLNAIAEITDIPEVFPLPHLPPLLQGAINFRGDVIPIVNIAKLLHLSESNALHKKNMLMITGEAEDRIGFIIEDIPDTEFFQPTDKMDSIPPVSENLAPYINNAYQKQEQVYLEIDLQQMTQLFI